MAKGKTAELEMNLDDQGLPLQTAPVAPVRWPMDQRAELERYYGKHELGPDGTPTDRWKRAKLTLMSCPYPLRLAWDTDVKVSRVTVHCEIAKSLQDIFAQIFQHYNGDMLAIQAAGMDLFGGCYNYRPARGLARLSTHAWAVAIDLDPGRNGLGKKWQPDAGMMPERVIQIFEEQGWTWGGRWTRPDCMHFQAART